MQPNDVGRMVASVWAELPNRFPFLLVDEFVTMPNHLHGILVITDHGGESRLHPDIIPDRRGESCIRPHVQGDVPSKGDHKDRPYMAPQPSSGRGETGLRPRVPSEGDHKDRPYHDKNSPRGTTAGTVGRIIQAFKSLTTHEYTVGVNSRDWEPFPGQLWQRNYHEHVIRNEGDLHRIHEYIQTNPLRWELDRENPAKQGEDEFDRWLESLVRKRERGK